MSERDAAVHPSMQLEPKLTYLPDETVFSLVSRLQRLWGFTSPSQTARVLFGHEWSGRRHDFPCALESLVANTEGAVGTASTAAREHTLLRYYLPFRSEAEGGRALQSMLGGSLACAAGWLGLSGSKLGADHPLKACPVCIRESVEEFGWAYWLLRHQFPGVWICPWHGEPLMVFADGGKEITWCMPASRRLDRIWAAPLKDSELDSLERLANLTIRLVATNPKDGYLNFHKISLTLDKKLRQKFGKTRGKKLEGTREYAAAMESWLDHLNLLRATPEFFGRFPAIYLWHGRNRGAWFRVNPVLDVLAIDWLFGSLEGFLDARVRDAAEVSCICTDWLCAVHGSGQPRACHCWRARVLHE